MFCCHHSIMIHHRQLSISILFFLYLIYSFYFILSSLASIMV